MHFAHKYKAVFVRDEAGFGFETNFNFPIIKVINGTDENNTLSGNSSLSEHIFGWGGDDIIYGGRLDYLYGGTGNDILIGSIGYNYFSGGEGFDTIVLNDVDTSSRDEIINFNAAQDKIQLNGSKFTALNRGVLSESLFYIGEKGTGNWHPDTDDRILYDKTNLTLDYKAADGSLVRLGILTQEFNSPDLSHVNFFIV
jgi:Ca2+-binding RTX toxin-like protein